METIYSVATEGSGGHWVGELGEEAEHALIGNMSRLRAGLAAIEGRDLMCTYSKRGQSCADWQEVGSRGRTDSQQRQGHGGYAWVGRPSMP